MRRTFVVLRTGLCGIGLFCARGSSAGESGDTELVIVSHGKAHVKIILSSSPGPREKRAAEELVHYVEQMSGATIPDIHEQPAIDAALSAEVPRLIIGQ